MHGNNLIAEGKRRWPWFAALTLLGVALRCFFITNYPEVQGDSFVYGDIAKNWMLHGIYGITTGAGVQPTYIRLPAYPAFLVAVFKIFGMEHYTAAMVIQLFVDLATCFLIAALAWELFATNGGTEEAVSSKSRERAALVAFALAALCPFTANFVAAPLTETWAIFFTALVFYLAARALRAHSETSALRFWIFCGLAVGASMLLRPDDGMLLAIIGGALVIFFFRRSPRRFWLRAGVAFAVAALIWLAPWTARNLRTMHRFQPLAPRYANDPEDFVPMGFNRWTKTWIVDFISVYRVYWNVDGADIDPTQLPQRAWGDANMRPRTAALIAEYNGSDKMSPALDAGFAALAAERIRRHPFEYYLGLPLARIASMWLRPRTEILPIELDWWNWNDHDLESDITFAMIAVNAFPIVLALVGFFRARRVMRRDLLWMVLAFVLLRSAFLGSMENPEPRYTLECFPVVFALAGAAFVSRRTTHATATS